MKIEIKTIINEQIQKEFYSSYLYLSMSAFAKNKGFDGIANWFNIQSQEERDHAMGFFYYLLERGEKVDLLSIQQPKIDFIDAKNLFRETLIHEQYITKNIHNIFILAQKEGDVALQSFISWYIDEQVEEESNAKSNIDKLEMVTSTAGGILYFDQMLSQRIYAPALPPTFAKTNVA